MHTGIHNRISPLALSVTLLICSALWFVSACEWYAHSCSKDGWSETPLLWMQVLAAAPIVCVIGGVALVIARRQSRLTWFDWCVLLVAFTIVVLSGFLAFMVLDSMQGMHIL